MIIDLPTALINRACAALEDPRAIAIAQALDLPAGAAWILARMEEEPQALARTAVRRRLPRSDLAILRGSLAIGPILNAIRDTLGADAILTEPDGYRLTPLGRVRIRLALGEAVL
ncbi:hypothetical protein D3C77_399500 [compost metagenome]